MGIIFVEKSRSSSGSYGNVPCTITVIKTSGKSFERGLRFSISGSAKEIVFKKFSFAKIGVDSDRNRIYFLPTDSSNGYKLANQNNSARWAFVVGKIVSLLDDPESFIGSYEFEFDPYEKMWFISLEHKL